jgi:hypothetical protein
MEGSSWTIRNWGCGMRGYLFLLAGLGCLVPLQAQDATPVQQISVPILPNAANIAPPGSVQLEFLGVCKTYMRDEKTYLNVPVNVNFGIVEDLEFRVTGSAYSRSGGLDTSSISGSSDVWAGMQWRPIHSGIFKADGSLQYMHKFPTAGKDLGSGVGDDTVGLIFNKFSDQWDWVDARLFCTWLGRRKEWGGGTARETSASLSISHPLNKDWSLGGKLGASSETSMSARTVSVAGSVSRRIASNCYVTAGVDCGLNRDAPEYTAFLGISLLRNPSQRQSSPVVAPPLVSTSNGLRNE